VASTSEGDRGQSYACDKGLARERVAGRRMESRLMDEPSRSLIVFSLVAAVALGQSGLFAHGLDVGPASASTPLGSRT
jgi:hypothetical protein